MNKLPPYAKQLRTRLQNPELWQKCVGTSADGRHVTLFLICGPDAWNVARNWISRRLLVVLPPDARPERFDWSVLSGHPPVLIHRAGHVHPDIIERIAAAALRDGVERLFLLGSDGIRYMTGQEVVT